MIYVEMNDGATILITGSWDSTIKVYDIKIEESSLLRVMSGGHQDSEITALAHNE